MSIHNDFSTWTFYQQCFSVEKISNMNYSQSDRNISLKYSKIQNTKYFQNLIERGLQR